MLASEANSKPNPSLPATEVFGFYKGNVASFSSQIGTLFEY